MQKHDWVISPLGHGYFMCRRCFVTMMEAAALGISNVCEVERTGGVEPPTDSLEGCDSTAELSPQ